MGSRLASPVLKTHTELPCNKIRIRKPFNVNDMSLVVHTLRTVTATLLILHTTTKQREN